MELQLFLKALPQVALSPFAFVCYIVVALIWLYSINQTARLKIIARKIRDLPPEDRLPALRDMGIYLKEGLDSDSYLTYKRRELIFLSFAITLLTIIVVFSLVVYRSIEERKHDTTIKTMSLAISSFKLGLLNADEKRFREAAGNLEPIVRQYPSYDGFMNLGYVFEEISETQKAIAAYENASHLRNSEPEPLNALGFMYKDSGDMKKAETALLKCIDLCNQQKGREELLFMAYGNLGSVYYEEARMTDELPLKKPLAEKAIKYYEKSMDLKRYMTDQDLLARVMSNLANTYVILNDMKKAKELYQHAILIKRRLSQNRSLGETLNNYAELLIRIGDLTQAQEKLEEAKQIFQMGENKLGLGAVLINEGDVFLNRGDKKSALSSYRQARDIFIESGIGGFYIKAANKKIQRLEKS